MTDDLQAEWHRATTRELEARVKNRTFFVTIEPEETAGEGTTDPEEVDSPTWEAVADSVERWLEGLDPKAIDPDAPPSFQVQPGNTPIELSATPKKEKRQGSDPLIVNPFPGVPYFPGSYTTGPPPEFDDGTEPAA